MSASYLHWQFYEYHLCFSFDRFLEYIFSAFNKASQKYFEEKSMILHSLCTSLELIGAPPAKSLPSLKPVEVNCYTKAIFFMASKCFFSYL